MNIYTGVVTQRCEMVDFYPSKEEVENNKQDIDYEILSKFIPTNVVHLQYELL